MHFYGKEGFADTKRASRSARETSRLEGLGTLLQQKRRIFIGKWVDFGARGWSPLGDPSSHTVPKKGVQAEAFRVIEDIRHDPETWYRLLRCRTAPLGIDREAVISRSDVCLDLEVARASAPADDCDQWLVHKFQNA